MKRISTFLLFLSILFLASCKFDQKPDGVYTGTFTATNWLDSAGTATVTIVESSTEHYDITFSSPGNPDLFEPDVLLPRTEWSHSNNSFQGSGGPFQIYVREYDEFDHIPWYISVHYYTYIGMVSTTIEFVGSK